MAESFRYLNIRGVVHPVEDEKARSDAENALAYARSAEQMADNAQSDAEEVKEGLQTAVENAAEALETANNSAQKVDEIAGELEEYDLPAMQGTLEAHTVSIQENTAEIEKINSGIKFVALAAKAGKGSLMGYRTDNNLLYIRAVDADTPAHIRQLQFAATQIALIETQDNGASWNSLFNFNPAAVGKKTLWSGNVTKGATGVTFDTTGYDMVLAHVGGCWIPMQNLNAGANARKKFCCNWSGRDTATGETYEQQYILDILANGTVATCGWFNVQSMNIHNAQAAGQKALQCATGGTAWSDPTWWQLSNVESALQLTQVVGFKLPTLA